MADAELAGLLDLCSRGNLKWRITGALAYHDRHFLQVLEGSRASVTDLYGRIRRDRRNHSHATIFQAPVSERLFAEWSMGWVPEEELRLVGFDPGILCSAEASLGALSEIFTAFRKVARTS